LENPGDIVFRHACKIGLEGIVSKRPGSRYISGRSRDWLKFKNPAAPAATREFEEDWEDEAAVNIHDAGSVPVGISRSFSTGEFSTQFTDGCSVGDGAIAFGCLQR